MWLLLSSVFSCVILLFVLFFFFKQKTAYEMRISDWSSDVCSSDLFAAQIATLGLKRGLAEQLSTDGRPDTHVVWDALLVGWIVSAIAAVEIGRASCRERVCQYV